MFSEVPDFPAWFPNVDGFPRPDWKAIGKWIRSNVSEDQWDAAWPAIVRVWLEKTCEQLGGSYTTGESENFHLLSELEPKPMEELLSFLEQTRARILRILVNISLPKRHGKHVVLRFTSEDDYYGYISFFYPDGDYGGSLGIFLTGSGYMHIAYAHIDSPGADRITLAHELSHNLLSSFPLPLWLSEALASLFERDLAGGRQRILDRELAARHHAYWNSQTIQEFWAGTAFSNPESQDLAYGLARILLDFITTDLRPAPQQFRDFVLHAHYQDTGESAARTYLGVELTDLVSAFLGPGDWGPKPYQDTETG